MNEGFISGRRRRSRVGQRDGVVLERKLALNIDWVLYDDRALDIDIKICSLPREALAEKGTNAPTRFVCKRIRHDKDGT